MSSQIISKNSKLADWTRNVSESEIRRLLRLQPKYNFAGGLPGNQPVNIMGKILKEIVTDLGNDNIGKHHLLNYGSTEGSSNLREILANRMRNREDISVEKSDVVISTGSQQALYGLLKVIINPKDIILTSRPTYLGFLGTAATFNSQVITIPTDKYGIIPEGIEAACRLSLKLFSRLPKVIYLQSFSENPTGISLEKNRMRQIYDICVNQGILIIEDAAYKEIQFDPTYKISPIKRMDRENEHVAYLGTSSKEAAVLRVGYSIIPEQIKIEFIKLKGYLDLCTPSITQEIAEKYYEKHIDKVLPIINQRYKLQAEAMKKTLDEFMPGERTDPKGGFFIWQKLPNTDTRKRLEEAIANGILYVPGEAFYPRSGYSISESLEAMTGCQIENNTMRLSYSGTSVDDIQIGIEKLSEIFQSV